MGVLISINRAASILNVSVSYLLSLLDDNAIPAYEINSRRWVEVEQLMEYKRKDDEARSVVMNELAAETQAARFVDLVDGVILVATLATLGTCGFLVWALAEKKEAPRKKSVLSDFTWLTEHSEALCELEDEPLTIGLPPKRPKKKGEETS